jgi:hypothetical protein
MAKSRKPKAVGTFKIGNKEVPDYGKRQGRGRLGGNKSTDTGKRLEEPAVRRTRKTPKPSGGKNASEAVGQSKGSNKSARKKVSSAKRKAGGSQAESAQKPQSTTQKVAAGKRATKKAAKKSSPSSGTPRKRKAAPKRAVKTPGKKKAAKKRSVGRVKNRSPRK